MERHPVQRTVRHDGEPRDGVRCTGDLHEHRFQRCHKFLVERGQHPPGRTLEHRHVPPGELPPGAETCPLGFQFSQEPLDFAHGTEAPRDQYPPARADERQDLVAGDMVGQQHRIRRQPVPKIVRRRKGRERVRIMLGSRGQQTQTTDLLFQLAGPRVQLRERYGACSVSLVTEQPTVHRVEVGLQRPGSFLQFRLPGGKRLLLGDAGDQVYQRAGLGPLGDGEGASRGLLALATQVQQQEVFVGGGLVAQERGAQRVPGDGAAQAFDLLYGLLQQRRASPSRPCRRRRWPRRSLSR